LPIVGEAASAVCFLFRVPAAGAAAFDIAGDVAGAEDVCACWDCCCGIVFGGCFSGELTPDGVVFGEPTFAVLIGVEPGGIECVIEGETLPE
jgi:hypothetical protein